MIHNDTYYEVKTPWGFFKLDEGAYKDYLQGKLWINWNPGKPHEQNKVGNATEPSLTNISQTALQLRDNAGKHGVYNLLQQLIPGEEVLVPYHPRMSELSIEEMNLSVRSSNGLLRAGASTFGKLKALMDRENGLRGVRNLGAKSEKEINISFISSCYQQLSSTEKAVFWQKVLDKSC